jgi:hypothetical protein
MKTKMISKPFPGRLILLALAVKNKNVWYDIYNDIKNKFLISEDLIVSSKEIVTGDFVTIIDEDYPQSLKEQPFPPFVILFDKKDQQSIGDKSSEIIIKKLQQGGN